MPERMPFIDLQAQQARLGPRIPDAIGRVLGHGRYIMGPEVAALEARLGAYCGCRHVISCANGTEALVMVLMAWGLGPGDAVFVPSFTFVATGEAVALVGATPVFVDVRADTFNLDPVGLETAMAVAESRGLRSRAVIPVDLFGLPADYPVLDEVAARLGLAVLCDAAQSFGARLHGRAVGTFGDASTTSFFPAKPLGCYGDGGAIFTDDDDLAARLRSIRVHGQGDNKYDNVRVGLNGRLDTLQAAILLEKLDILNDEMAARQRIAARYSEALGDVARTPTVPDGAQSAWAQYTIMPADRDAVIAACDRAGVPTQIYYPVPMHAQPGYASYPTAPGGCPVSDTLAGSVVSLPMHPYLDEAGQDRVIAAVRGACAS